MLVKITVNSGGGPLAGHPRWVCILLHPVRSTHHHPPWLLVATALFPMYKTPRILLLPRNAHSRLRQTTHNSDRLVCCLPSTRAT